MTPGKIPVLRCVGAGIAFGIGRLFSVIRAGWFALLIMYASLLGVFWVAFPSWMSEWPPKQETSSNFTESLAYIPLFYLILVMAVVMLSTGITKAYFRQPIGWLYFRFGAAEIRALIALVVIYFLLILANVVVLGGFAAIAGLFLDTANAQSPNPDPNFAISDFAQLAPLGVIPGVLFFILFFLLNIYLMLRFSLVMPIIVREKRVGVIRSFRLTRRNVWRLFLAVVITLLIAFSMLAAVQLGTNYLVYGHVLGPIGIEDIQEVWTTTPELTIEMIPIAVLNLVVLLAYQAMFIGTTCRAYEALADPSDAEAG